MKPQKAPPIHRPADVKKLAELGIIRALPTIKAEDIVKQGRLLGRIHNLEKACTIEMRKVKGGEKLYLQHKDTILKLLTIFGEMTGWMNKGVHLLIGASFCLKIIENSEFEYTPKIAENLNDIIDYFGRGNVNLDETFEEVYPIAIEAWNNLEVCKDGNIVKVGGCENG